MSRVHLHLVVGTADDDDTPATIEANAVRARTLLAHLLGDHLSESDNLGPGRCQDCKREVAATYRIGSYTYCLRHGNPRALTRDRALADGPLTLVGASTCTDLTGVAPPIVGACQQCGEDAGQLAPLGEIFACDSCIRRSQQEPS